MRGWPERDTDMTFMFWLSAYLHMAEPTKPLPPNTKIVFDIIKY